MASAAFTAEGQTSESVGGVQVTAGATVNLALASAVGVRSVEWTILGKSDSTEDTPTITPAGTPSGVTATFPMNDPIGDVGFGLRLRCRVNGGKNAAGVIDNALISTGIVGVVSANGIIPFVFGEEGERGGNGITDPLNEALALAGGGAGVTRSGSSSDNALTRWNGTGTSIQSGPVDLDDDGKLTGANLEIHTETQGSAPTTDANHGAIYRRGTDVFYREPSNGTETQLNGGNALTAPENPAEDALVAIASGGDLIYDQISNTHVASDAAIAQSKLALTAPSTPAAIGTAATGSGPARAYTDHVHAHGAQTDPANHALAVANTSAGFMSGNDKGKLDSTNPANAAPEDLADSAAIGVSARYALQDHAHRLPPKIRTTSGGGELEVDIPAGGFARATLNAAANIYTAIANAGNGHTVIFAGGDAAAASNGDGGPAILQPGAKDGSGADAEVGIKNAAAQFRVRINPTTGATEIGDVSGDVPLSTDDESAYWATLSADPGAAPTDGAREYRYGDADRRKYDDSSTTYYAHFVVTTTDDTPAAIGPSIATVNGSIIDLEYRIDVREVSAADTEFYWQRGDGKFFVNNSGDTADCSHTEVTDTGEGGGLSSVDGADVSAVASGLTITGIDSRTLVWSGWVRAVVQPYSNTFTYTPPA